MALVGALVLVEMWAYHQQFADREEHYRPQLRETLRAAREVMSAREQATRKYSWRKRSVRPASVESSG